MITLILLLIFVGFSFAGEGGYVYLVNLSGSDWKQTHIESNSMNWKFPALLKNGESELVYVEFKDFLFLSHSQAQVDYELVGTGGKSFQILASGKIFKSLAIYYNNLEVNGKPKGWVCEIGWKHDGDNNVIIIGKNGRYTGTCLDGSNWMKNNMDVLGSRTLRQISIAGSHDSGMFRLDGGTAFGTDCNVLTQYFNFWMQLKQGIRYFDIRPVIGNGGKYHTGHYNHIPGSWQGGNGQSIASIITDLNYFTKNHNELIIIKLSHSLNTEVGPNSYRKFNQEEWERLFQKLDAINHLYKNDDRNVHLDQITLGNYTNNGSKSSVVIIVDDPDSNVELGSRWGTGYFMPQNLDIYDDYSKTNQWRSMINDQIQKMHNHSSKQYFILSWTLTQSDSQAALCHVSFAHEPIKELAKQANNQLGILLYSQVSASSFPNIILVDGISSTDVATMALAISTKIML
ncbi:uncharacterized protein [Halyomorpha halys]|uniref:uncharacterized protein n=1 Tax=Halyomorpha halys TaxID=286706 RepID=UPI0034D349C9